MFIDQYNNNLNLNRSLLWLTRLLINLLLVFFALQWSLTVQAANDTPDKLVAINTIDFDNSGNQGILVELNRFCGDASNAPTCFYMNPGSASDVQMLVLDQKTLLPFTPSGQSGGNLSFSTDTDGLSDLNTVLIDLEQNADAVDQVLVILVFNSTSPVAFSSIALGLEAIGQKIIPPAGRPWSIIGVPGMVPGKAAFNLNTSINSSEKGGLKGYIRESWLYQNGQQFQHRLFDFGYVQEYSVTPVADAANYQNAKIELAGTVHAPPVVSSGSSAGGFYVIQFDTTTLDIISSSAVWITNDTGCVDFAALNNLLKVSSPPTLTGVAVASLGKAWNDKAGCSASDWKELLATVEMLGLNPDIFARAVDTNLASPYSMISSNGRFGNRLAYQASAVLTDWVAIQTGNTTGAQTLPQANGALTGALKRDNLLGQIYPATGDPGGLYTTELEKILVQEPVSWAMTPAAGATATTQETALGWVISCSQDVMATEWNNGVPSSNEVVRQTALTLRQSYIDVDFTPKSISPLPTACDGSGFSQGELANAVSQLTDEFGDRTDIQSYFTTLMKPLVDNTTSLFNTITDVTTEIANNELNADTTLTISNSSNWGASIFQHTLQGLQIALNFFGEGPAVNIIGDFLSATSSGFKFILNATAGSPTGQENETDEYLILESQLSVKSTGVKTQVEDSISQWRDSMGTSQAVVLQDWGKMMAVSANLVPGGKWLFTEDDVNTMANAWDTLARQQTYYTYWPLVYNVGAARVSSDGSFPASSGSDSWHCFGNFNKLETNGEIGEADIYPFVNNGGITFSGISDSNGNTDVPSFGTCNSEICGVGDGQSYLPLYDIFASDPEELVVYMFKNSWNLSYIDGWAQPDSASGTKGQGYAHSVPSATMTSLSAQITSSSADTAGNFYPPTFWFNARSPNQLACNGSSNAKLVPIGFYSDSVETATVIQTMNASAYKPGDSLMVGISVQNIPYQADFFFGAVAPDGDTLYFVTAFNPFTIVQGSLNDPRTFHPYSDRELIPNESIAHLPNFIAYTFTGLEQEGMYVFFSVLSPRDVFADGMIDHGDFISIDTDMFGFSKSQ